MALVRFADLHGRDVQDDPYSFGQIVRMRNPRTGEVLIGPRGDSRAMAAEMEYREQSTAGQGMEFHGCPECGGFGHGSSVHK